MAGVAYVIITVQAANNGPPNWIIPSRPNQTFQVSEGLEPGQPVVTVIANDTDQGNSGVVTYYFWYNGTNTTSTPYFNINEFNGQITTNQEFDRETRDTYYVTLVARDRGKDPKQTNTTIIINIADADDNYPEFPSYRNCCTITYYFNVTENREPEVRLGRVRATDKDIGPNAEIKYYIVSGNNGEFRIDNVTGTIYTMAKLDRETKSTYKLSVRALGKDNPRPEPKPGCHPECKDPSFVEVYVQVNDKDDQAPSFGGVDTLYACVSVNAPFGKSVTTIYAEDMDSQSITYGMGQIQALGQKGHTPRFGAFNNTFRIVSSNGTIFTNDLMQKFDKSYFNIAVYAMDTGGNRGNAKAQIWVTDPAMEITLTSTKDRQEVKKEQDQIIDYIKQQLKNPDAVVCINDIRYHIDEGQNIVPEMTDILIHIVNPEKEEIYSPDDVVGVIWPPDGNALQQLAREISLSAITRTRSAHAGFPWAWLGVIIAVLLFLLLLALLLCCCLPWCLALCCGEKHKKRQALYLTSAMAPTGMVNPLWSKGYEDQELNMEVTNMADDMNLVVTGNYNMAFKGDGVDGRGGITETTTKEYAMNYEHTRTMMNDGNLAIEGTGPTPRIEAPLEPRLDSASGIRAPSMSTAATQYDAMGRAVGPALIMDSHGNLQRPTSPSGIGATLHTSHTDLSQFSYSIKSEQHSPPVHDYRSMSYSSMPAVPVHHHEIETEWEEDYPANYQGEIVVGTYSSPPQLTPVPPQTVTENKHYDEFRY